MSSTKRIISDERFICPQVGKSVRFTVTEVSLYSGSKFPDAIANSPKCSSSYECSLFPVDFPQEMGDVPVSVKTGCPVFDRRKPEVV
jgi:hypothetical protein